MLKWEVLQNFALMAQLSAAVTTASLHLDSKMPFVTNSEFEISGGYTDGLSGILSVALAPLVNASNQTVWENYAVDHQYWVSEGGHLRKTHLDHKDPIHGSFQDHEDRKLASRLDAEDQQEDQTAEDSVPRIPGQIYALDADGGAVPYQGIPGEILLPVWQVAPTPADDPKVR